jgi:hypothetical protein
MRPSRIVATAFLLIWKAAAQDPQMDVHGLHAAMLHLLGLEHANLTFCFHGRRGMERLFA